MAVVVVTGAGRGIGLELARRLVARGDTVIATVRDPAHAAVLTGIGAQVERLDVTDAASVAAFGAALAGRTVDVLVNNAGVFGQRGGGLAALDMTDVRAVFEANVIGPLAVTQALLPALRRSTRARVLSISSTMGQLSTGAQGAIGYRASKAALNKAMQACSQELMALGIVSALAHPGWVRTDMGGGSADIPVEESAAGLIALVDRLGPADAGRFFLYTGAPAAW